MLPGIQRWSDAKVLDEAADLVARMALGACDGQPHNSPFCPPTIGYPTRRRTEALVRLALTPANEPAPYARGFSLDEIFAAAWERVAADEGEDPAAAALLLKKHEEIMDGKEAWKGDAEDVDRAAAALASFDPESLWVLFVQAAYPDHPQTPGSEKWIAAWIANWASKPATCCASRCVRHAANCSAPSRCSTRSAACTSAWPRQSSR